LLIIGFHSKLNIYKEFAVAKLGDSFHTMFCAKPKDTTSDIDKYSLKLKILESDGAVKLKESPVDRSL
jgi:hypothetical protein